MKSLLPLVFTLFCTHLFILGFSQDKARVSRIKIHASVSDLERIRQAGIFFDHGHYDMETLTYINETAFSDIVKIQQLGLKVDILVGDVFAYTDSLNLVEDPYKYENARVRVDDQFKNMRLNFTASSQSYETFIPTPSTFSLGSRGGFYDLTELEAQIDDMVAKYPGLVTKSNIGFTFQNRPIWVIKISDNAVTDETEPELMYTGMHHSREGMSMMNLIFFMRFMLENYSSNAAIKDIIDNRELFFIPVVNIDGFNYNTTLSNWNAGRRMRRKSMTETTTTNEGADGSGGDGVDLNRNYGTYWGVNYSNNNTASSATPSADAYRGSSAFSEVETQHMRDFVNSRNFKMAINYHCYGNWWIRPQGPDPSVYPTTALPTAAINTYNSIASLFTKYNCYVYGTAAQTVYDVNGYSDDWLFSDPSHSPIYSFSPEIGNSSDGFWCPQAKIIPYAKELIFPNIQAAYTAGSYAELQDISNIALNSLSGSFDFTVTRKGLVDAPVSVSLIPVVNIQNAGTPIVIPSIPSFGGTYSGKINYTLPTSISQGSIVRFIWQMETGGLTFRDTINKIYNPTVVFSDDMETATKFSTNWVKSKQQSTWAYSSTTGFAGSASLTESANGSYGSNTDHSVSLAKALDLSSATKVYLSFLVKYATENCQDRLQVEISTAGVNGTYTPITTSNTVLENRGSLGAVPALTGSTDGWVREMVDLTSYAGNNNIGLRFRFRSNGSNTAAYPTDGFYIDNIQVVKTSAVILPISFEDITATRTGEAILVKWKATIDADFDYYAVQRSGDGVNYETISEITDGTVVSYLDKSPLQGQNYYRIKAVEKSGIDKFSKIVRVVFANSITTSVYPNPVTDMLNVEVTSDKEIKVIVEVTTIEGIVVYKSAIGLKPGSNIHKILMSKNINQYYILKIKSETGSILNTFKILKSTK